MTTIIFILELVALAALIICGALLILDAGSKKKRPWIRKENVRGGRKARPAGNIRKERGRTELWSTQRQ